MMTALTERNGTSTEEVLDDILSLSTRIENVVARTNFRFGATGAYEAIVQQRVEVLREERFLGRQLFSEFMMRRYDPAMRTVKSAERQMQSLTERAARAANLLRTKVDVGRQAQNQALLESMDKRADLQLRLQETVEGLSVVAISYYAVSLVGYLIYPFSGPFGGLERRGAGAGYAVGCPCGVAWSAADKETSSWIRRAVIAPPTPIEISARMAAKDRVGTPDRPAPTVHPPARTPPMPIKAAPAR